MRKYLLVPLLFFAWVAGAAELDLGRLKLPPGFHISIFAQAPRARMMAFSPGGVLLVTCSEDGKVLALPDAGHSGRAEKVVTVLEGLNTPHGIAFHQGQLYIAENDKVVRYEWNESQLRAANPRTLAQLPPDGEHTTRTLLFANGKMYVSVGSDCNVCVEKDQRRAAVLEFNPDGSGERIFARGLRNAVGMTSDQKTGTIVVTENGRDHLGDDLPPDEIDDLGKNGGDFGWPYCYGNRVPDPAHKEAAGRCSSTIPATVNLQAHSAPLGLAFYTGTAFPAEYRSNLFVAYHGSWNRSIPTGYKLVRLKANAAGEPQGPAEDFITGWLTSGNSPRRVTMGRPVGIIVGQDGAMYISDDHAGVIYRVTYAAGK